MSAAATIFSRSTGPAGSISCWLPEQDDIMTIFKAAAIQMRSGTSVDRNAATFETMVREAAAHGAVYIQTPEMTGALMRDRESLKASLRDGETDLIASTARRLARELGVHIHVGSTAIAAPGGKIANRAFLAAPDGSILATYDKIHMFDVDLDNGESWRESATYQPGERTVIAELPFANIGMAVCYDLRFPQLFRAQAVAGAEVLTTPAAFTRQTGEAHWHVLLRARAIENGAWVISAAQGGTHEDGRETFGHSIIIDPWGRIVAEADHAEPGIIYAEIDTAASAEARKKIPNLKNAREFSVDVARPAAPLKAAS
jgi:predicted amidohydrolase